MCFVQSSTRRSKGSSARAPSMRSRDRPAGREVGSLSLVMPSYLVAQEGAKDAGVSIFPIKEGSQELQGLS